MPGKNIITMLALLFVLLATVTATAIPNAETGGEHRSAQSARELY